MEVDIWNEYDLARPALVTLKVRNASFVERFHSTLSARMHRQKLSQSDFRETAALVGRIIARRKNSFRRMSGFREFCKLNAAIRRLERLDIRRDLENLLSCTQDAAYGEEQLAELPTRNCLDYVLVRLVTVHKLHSRISDCCLRTAEYFVEMIRANNFLDISTLVLAVVAKLKKLSATLANCHISLYECLKEQRACFPHKGEAFLANENVLPDLLQHFELERKPDVKTDDSKSKFNQALPESPETKVPVNTSTTFVKPRKSKDVGVELKRKSLPNQPKNQSKAKIFNIDTVTKIEDVKTFMIEEHKARKANSTGCITKNIQAHEWAGLEKLIQRKIVAGDNQKAVNIFKKFISGKL